MIRVRRCISGTFSETPHATQCLDCKAGRFASSIQSSRCTNCSIGRASNLAKLGDDCPLCTPGFYAPEPGLTACKPCPTGKVTAEYNSASCRPCELPFYQFGQGASVCSVCDFGKYARVLDNAIADPPCEDCPTNAVCTSLFNREQGNSTAFVPSIVAKEGYWLSKDPATGKYRTLRCDPSRCSSSGGCSSGRVAS